jgi:hypothetical protein
MSGGHRRTATTHSCPADKRPWRPSAFSPSLQGTKIDRLCSTPRAPGFTDACLRGGSRRESPGSAPFDDADHEWEHGEPRQARACRGSFLLNVASRFGCAPNDAPIRPHFSPRSEAIVLDDRRAGARVISCFASRKTNEAWNPGSFGCRGLLLCGLLPGTGRGTATRSGVVEGAHRGASESPVV